MPAPRFNPSRSLPIMAALCLAALSGCANQFDTDELEFTPAGGDNALGPGELPLVCDNFRVCGGDISGDWNWELICGGENNPDVLDGCPGASAETSFLTNGTLVMRRDLSFRLEGTIIEEVTGFIPFECVRADQECEDFEDEFVADRIVCVPQQLGCRCTGSSEQDIDLTGNYTFDGPNTVVFLDDERETARNDYCIQDNILMMRDREALGLDGITVFTRR